MCLLLRLSCGVQFSVFLGLIFFLELTAGILAFVFKDWIKDQLNFFINNNVKAYRDDIDLQNLIDFAQEYVSPPLLTETHVWPPGKTIKLLKCCVKCSFIEKVYYFPQMTSQLYEWGSSDNWLLCVNTELCRDLL